MKDIVFECKQELKESRLKDIKNIIKSDLTHIKELEKQIETLKNNVKELSKIYNELEALND